MSNLLSIIIAAALVNNVVLVQSLGVSSLFAYSARLRQAQELALLSAVVIFIACSLNLVLYRFILAPLHLDYLNLVCFVAVSAGISTIVVDSLHKRFPISVGQQQLAFYLVGGNSAVIGLSLLSTIKVTSLLENFAYSLGASLGFAFILLIFAALRLRLDSADIPKPFRGAPIQLISAGIASMCLYGFAGLV